MVSAVLEDLKHRWSKKLIEEEFQRSTHCLGQIKEYPWADMTVIVPGEADTQCAETARLTGSAVLTNDSDLLVHDLGPHGMAILLNSVQMVEDVQVLTEPEVRALGIHPYKVSRRLGIANIQQLAYTLTRNPRLSFMELLRRAKEDFAAMELSSAYCDFLREYEVAIDFPEVSGSKQDAQILDPRVSELLWQYEMPAVYCPMGEPHLYLGILHEDPTRRCAWEQGRCYRELGYSLFNLSQPAARRFSAIHEFVRRGGRIVAQQVTLSDTQAVTSGLESLQKRLDLLRSTFGRDSPQGFWVMFALSEIYRDVNSTAITDAIQLERFLAKGSMGKTGDWIDIHFLAQIQAILYSVRILKQLLDVTVDRNTFIGRRGVLADLPPLHCLMLSRHDIIQYFAIDDRAHRSVHWLINMHG